MDEAATTMRSGRGPEPRSTRIVSSAVAAGVIVGLAAVAAEALRVGMAPAMTLVPAEAVIAISVGLRLGWTVAGLGAESGSSGRTTSRIRLVGAVVLAYLVALALEVVLGMLKVGAVGEIPLMAPRILLVGAIAGIVGVPVTTRFVGEAHSKDPDSLGEAVAAVPTTIRDAANEAGLRSGLVLWPVLSAILAIAASLPVAGSVVLLLLPSPPPDNDPIAVAAVTVTWAGLSLLLWLALMRWGRQRAALARARRDAALEARRADSASDFDCD
jgi:hypothetical protein